METVESTELKSYEIPIGTNYITEGRKKLESDSDVEIYAGYKKDTYEKVVFKLKKNIQKIVMIF